MSRIDVDGELDRLRGMTVADLRAEYRSFWGYDCHCSNKQHLVKRIVWKIQADAEGWTGHSEETLKRARELADFSILRGKGNQPIVLPNIGRAIHARMTALTATDVPPPGTVLTREFKGRTLRCRVLERGFEFEGETYRSLSGAARAATGTSWNGYVFWG